VVVFLDETATHPLFLLMVAVDVLGQVARILAVVEAVAFTMATLVVLVGLVL